MENETITLDEDQIIDGIEEEADESELLHTQLPLSKIKKMAKLVPSLHMITAEGVKAITFASEVYVELLAKAAYQSAQEDGRKTVQMKDINRAIKRDWLFALLEDNIDDWPDFPIKSRNVAENSSTAIEDTNPDAQEMEEVDPSIEDVPETNELHEPLHSINLNEETMDNAKNLSPEKLLNLDEMMNASNENVSINVRDIEDL